MKQKLFLKKKEAVMEKIPYIITVGDKEIKIIQ